MSKRSRIINPFFAHRFGLNAPSQPDIEHRPRHSETELEKAVAAIRERNRIWEQIIETSKDPAEARRVVLACEIVLSSWLTSPRLCRDYLRAAHGVCVDANGVVSR